MNPNQALRRQLLELGVAAGASQLVASNKRLRQVGCHNPGEMDQLFRQMLDDGGDPHQIDRLRAEMMYFVCGKGAQCGSNSVGLSMLAVLHVLQAIRPDLSPAVLAEVRELVLQYLASYGAKVTGTAITPAKWTRLLGVIAEDVGIFFGLMYGGFEVRLRQSGQKEAVEEISDVMDLAPLNDGGRVDRYLGEQLIKGAVDDAVTALIRTYPETHLAKMLSLDVNWGPLLQLASATSGHWSKRARRAVRGHVTILLVLWRTEKLIVKYAVDNWASLEQDTRRKMATMSTRLLEAAPWGIQHVKTFAADHEGDDLARPETWALNGVADGHPDRVARALALQAMHSARSLFFVLRDDQRSNPQAADYTRWMTDYLEADGVGASEAGPWRALGPAAARPPAPGPGVLAFLAAQAAPIAPALPAPIAPEVTVVYDSEDE